MKVFVIFLILIGFVGIAYANEPKSFPGELDKPPIEIWNESRAIMDGTIIQKKQSEEWTNYDITINEMFKGTTKAKSITGFIPRNMDWVLDKGDRALIYLKSGNEISIYSVQSSNNCTPRDLIQISPVLPNDNSIVRGAPILPWDWKDPCVPNYFTYDPDFWNYMEYKPPLRQYVDHNLPLHMQRCGNDEHVSVIPKSHPYHIACVTESTKTKLIERGWTVKDDLVLKTSTNCRTLEQSKETAPFFKTPTYLPEGYDHVCSQSGTPFESYIVYYHREIPYWNIPELVSDGAIFIYQIDEKSIGLDKEFEMYVSSEQRTRNTYYEVMEKNPSLNPQLITINGMLAYAVDSCSDCGIQTANFTDGTVIQKSTSTETRIKFIDENGVSYMLKTTLPLNELIKVAESLQ